MADNDYDKYLDADEPDEAQLGLEREQQELDAEADRFEFFASDGLLGDGTLLLIEQTNGSFVAVRTDGYKGVH